MQWDFKVHKVKLILEVVPVQQKLKGHPFSVRQAEADELKDLEE